MNWSTLVQAEALAERLGEPGLRVFDARFSLADAAAGRTAYERGHLPGAQYADLDTELADLSVAGEGRHPLPDARAFAGRLGQWGVTPACQVVVYDAADGAMAAARMWWLLKLLGHERVAVLDGGYARWLELGLPVTTMAPNTAPVSPYPGGFNRSLIATAEDVEAQLGAKTGRLMDARAAARFAGAVEPIDPVAGHVPGAVNRPYSDSLREGMFKPEAEVREELESVLDGQPASDVTVMCGSGVTACHLLLAMEHAGLSGARVYAGSWSDWIQDPSRPVATGSD